MDHGVNSRDPEIDLLVRDIADAQQKIEVLTSEYFQLRADYMVAKRELSDPKLFEVQVEEALKQDALCRPAGESECSVDAPSDGSENLAVEKYRSKLQEKGGARIPNKPNVPLY